MGIEAWGNWLLLPQNQAKVKGRLVFLDTNVLISDSAIIHRYPSDTIAIPEVVLNELDSLKKTVDGAGVALSQLNKAMMQGKTNICLIPVDKYKPYVDDILIDGAEITGRLVKTVLVTGDNALSLKARSHGIDVEFIKIPPRISTPEKNVQGKTSVETSSQARRRKSKPVVATHKASKMWKLAVIVALALTIAATAFYYFTHSVDRNAVVRNAGGEVAKLQKVVETYNEQVKANPGDIALRTKLGDAYYDYGLALQEQGLGEAAVTFKKAVDVYQGVLAANPTELNVIVDMATAAFYCGENDIADENFQRALAIDPNFYNARLNYGVFLYKAKKDSSAAIKQWQAGLATNPAPEAANTLRTLIGQAQQHPLGSP